MQEWNVIWHKTLRMQNFHRITAFMKKYTNFEKIFLVRVFWLKYIFQIRFKIPILYLLLLPKYMLQKKTITFEGLYTSSTAVKLSD